MNKRQVAALPSPGLEIPPKKATSKRGAVCDVIDGFLFNVCRRRRRNIGATPFRRLDISSDTCKDD